jgi:hypothetical protein
VHHLSTPLVPLSVALANIATKVLANASLGILAHANPCPKSVLWIIRQSVVATAKLTVMRVRLGQPE